MPFKPALHYQIAATLRGVVFGMLMLLCGAQTALAANNFGPVFFAPIYTVNPDGSTRLIAPGSDGSTTIPSYVPPGGTTPGTVYTAPAPGATTPGGTTSGNTTTGTGTGGVNNVAAALANGSTSTGAVAGGGVNNVNVNINQQNPYCNQSFASAYNEAQEKALTVQLSRDNEFFKYQIAGAFAANCVGKMIGYAQNLADGVAAVQTAATAGSPIQAAVTIIAHRILRAVLQQIVSNLENQICSITNQLTSAMESVVQNAICIPSGDLKLGGLFNFNLNLNLPNLQCDGIAINPLQLTQLDPATGQPYAAAEGNYTAGTFAQTGAGNYSSGGGFGVPPQRTYGYGDSTSISGDPDVLTNEGDATGVTGVVGTVSASSNFKCFDMNKAIQYALSHATNGYQGSPPNGNCAVGVRMALCAGGMDRFCSGGLGNAKDYGSALINIAGYVKVGDENSPSFDLQPGCIIIDAATAGHPYGHIQMFAGGNTWVSDFTTSNMYGGSSYARNKNFDMYCPSTTLNQKADGTCK